MTNPNLMKGVDKYTHSVQIGVKLTATTVLLDTVVLTAKLITSRAETLQYVAIVSQLMLPFTALDPRYVFECGSQFNVAFPEKEAPGDRNEIKAETSTPLHCLELPVEINS